MSTKRPGPTKAPADGQFSISRISLIAGHFRNVTPAINEGLLYLILAHFEHEIANAGILICHSHSIKFFKFLVSKSFLHYLVMRVKIHFFSALNTFLVRIFEFQLRSHYGVNCHMLVFHCKKISILKRFGKLHVVFDMLILNDESVTHC